MPRTVNPWWPTGAAVVAWLASAVMIRQVALTVHELAVDPTAAVKPALQLTDALISVNLHTFSHAHPWTVWVAQFFALMGSAAVLAPVTVVLVVVLARDGHRAWAWWVGLCGIGGMVISEAVKYTVDRQRPQWPDPWDVVTSPSFPSGHSMAGIYGYVVFGVVVLALTRQRSAGVALIVFGMLMGPSRVLLGVHWTTDVLAGWLLATAWVCTAGAAVLWVGRSREAQRIAPGL